MAVVTRQNFGGIVWIVFAFVNAGIGVKASDPQVAAIFAFLSIAWTLLGAAFVWHERIPVLQKHRERDR
ncbi:hypothetical protein [Haloarchaeobius sp. HRN-SO-5]|uniref:hypothetical protein n=1 Tax=Haloarchaeobius sp. HRN-SO-5 TaxID=3446118 RepID=UPI003EC05B3D